MTRTTSARVTTNSRPLDYTRIERTSDYSGTLRLTALVGVGFVAVVLAVVGMGL